jgi:hypothetical protein
MQKLLMVFLITLIMGCSTIKPAVVVPSMEKYCPRPVRPYIAPQEKWDMPSLIQQNLVIIDYTLKLEETLDCWEDTPAKNK